MRNIWRKLVYRFTSCRRAGQKGYDVTVFDNFKFVMMNLQNIINEIDIIKGDFFNESDVNSALKDVHYVLYYISTTTPVTAIKDAIFDIESTIIRPVKLFQNSLENNVKKIIFTSSRRHGFENYAE